MVAGGREHAAERGEELIVGVMERQVHLPADGVPFLLHLDVVGAGARPAARGAHRRPPNQRLLVLPARAVVEKRQQRLLLERLPEPSLPARRRIRRAAAELVGDGEVVVDHGMVRVRWRQPELQLHVVVLNCLLIVRSIDPLFLQLAAAVFSLAN